MKRSLTNEKPLVYFCVVLRIIMSMFIDGGPSKMAVRTEVKPFKVSLFTIISVSSSHDMARTVDNFS